MNNKVNYKAIARGYVGLIISLAIFFFIGVSLGWFTARINGEEQSGLFAALLSTGVLVFSFVGLFILNIIVIYGGNIIADLFNKAIASLSNRDKEN